jgi:alkylresorcinol/alkylpyrone synthase
MPSIKAIKTAIPPNVVTQSEFVGTIVKQWIDDDPASLDRIQRIARNAGVDTRYFCLPYQEILALGGLQQRSQVFHRFGVDLLAKAVDSVVLSGSGDDIGYFISTSCSVPIIPSIDVAVIEKLEMSSSLRRVPIFQQGCAGGVVALSLAAELSKSGTNVLVGATELCSIVFHGEDVSPVQSVGASIFADGAAAMLVSPNDNGLAIRQSKSLLLSESRHLMGYDIRDEGFYLRLDRSLPSVLRDNVVPAVSEFLEGEGLGISDIDYWLFHPGGVRILEFLEDVLMVSPERCTWSRDVLREYGNMSSATILFVLERFMTEVQMQAGERAMVLGIGPGLTVEMVLLEQG